ncbi:hypothetical protein OIV83_005690 [Microbotryomycetes sp. JL201]|nr:hypothetical protein OIV83_005690 [Microbotryomycetes sp. JL201]
MNGRSFAEDALIFIVLLGVLCVPLIVLPSPVQSVMTAIRACVRSVGFVVTMVILLLAVLAAALVVEHVHAKYYDVGGDTKTDKDMRTPFGRVRKLGEKHDKRKQKEERFQHELETAVKPATKLWKDLTRDGSRQRKGRPDGTDEIELQQLPTGSTSGVARRRAPPPPPPR